MNDPEELQSPGLTKFLEAMNRPIPPTKQESWLVSACWVLTVIGSLLGIVIVCFGMIMAQSAPQEAVVVSLGIACAVVPYCLARAASELSK